MCHDHHASPDYGHGRPLCCNKASTARHGPVERPCTDWEKKMYIFNRYECRQSLPRMPRNPWQKFILAENAEKVAVGQGET